MKNLISLKWAVGLMAVVAISMWIGYGLNTDAHETEGHEDTLVMYKNALETPQESIYVCPMMCIPPQGEPGNCPICGMDLVPGQAKGGHTHTSKLSLSPEAIQMADIGTVKVERKHVSADVRLFGQIDYDPAHVTKITAFMPVVIDRVYVKRAGQFVRWGEPLFDVYSSDIQDTQKQLVEAMKYVPSFLAFQAGTPHAAKEMPIQSLAPVENPGVRSSEAQAALETIRAIRQKLSILGLPKRDIDELMKKGEVTGIATVYSSVYGQVIEQNAYEGAFINTGTPIFTIGDPHYVWVKMDAYEADYPWIRQGQDVTFNTDAYPGETFSAKVVYIDPVFNNNTRTFTMGAVTPDYGGRLKAGMLVRANLESPLSSLGTVRGPGSKDDQPPLVIPISSPLITGKRAIVYVKSAEEEGIFEGREITLGPKARDFYVVLSGLKEGESVVSKGNFKLDSASQILARPSMMMIEGGNDALGHQDHGGSDVVNRDYWHERMKSRNQVVQDRVPDLDLPQKDAQKRSLSRDRTTILRRKPGAYGNVTR